MSVAAKNHASDAALCNSRVHVPSGQHSSCTLAQAQQPAHNNDSPPPPHDLWDYVELGPSLSSLLPYLMPTPCLPGMMVVEQTQLEITWWMKCLQVMMITLQSQLYVVSPSLSDIDVLY
jgi:hypothetical protein